VVWYVEIEGISGSYPVLSAQEREGDQLFLWVADGERRIVAVPARVCRVARIERCPLCRLICDGKSVKEGRDDG